MKILPVIMGYPGAQYCCDRGFERWEKQMPYPEWYKKEFVHEGLYWDACINDEQKKRWNLAASKIWNWRNHDLRMLEYFDAMTTYTDDTHFLFLEPDVYMPEYVTKEWLNDNIIRQYCVRVPRCFHRGDLPNWKYWKDLNKLTDNERVEFDSVVCVPPLSCILIPRKAMEDLLWIKNNTTIFQRDIFCELRLPMLLQHLEYKIIEERLFDGIRCFPKPHRSDKTPFFHPYRK